MELISTAHRSRKEFIKVLDILEETLAIYLMDEMYIEEITGDAGTMRLVERKPSELVGTDIEFKCFNTNF